MLRRAVACRASVLLVVLFGGGARAADAPSYQGNGRRLAVLATDPAGDATRIDREALALLTGDAPDPEGAAQRWMDLAEADLPAWLEAPKEAGAPGAPAPTEGLWWPAREIAFSRLAALPPEGRAAVERRWGGAAETALRAGDVAALERAARDAPVTSAGGRALVLLADRDLEAGRASDAALRLDLWLRLHPEELETRRGAVAARLAGALALADDERGLVSLARRAVLLGDTPIVREGSPATLAEIIATSLRDVRGRVTARARDKAAAVELPEDPVVLWTRSLVDTGLLRPPDADPSAEGILAAAACDGPSVYLAEARVVRRLDRATGLLRWTWPDEGRLPREHAHAARYRAWEGPVRDVAVAGDLVLAVLGDPPVPATSMFVHRGAAVRPLSMGREMRTRLVALDAVTGTPRWVTGSPEEAHPVLRALDVAVASPVLVAGDTAYVVLSARRDRVVSWLAALDVATGRPRFVTPLAAGDSTIERRLDADRSLFDLVAHSVPRAGRPALAGDEVCVATGAGYVAGVGARDGRRRWLRAVPAYRHVWTDDPVEPIAGRAFAPRQSPLAAYGSWFVGAPDACAALAIERGTGRLRWAAAPGRLDPPNGVAEAPDASWIVDVVPRRDGHVEVRSAGERGGVEVRDAVGGETRGLWPGSGPARPVVRPWAEPGRWVTADAAGLRAREGPGGGPSQERLARPSNATALPEGDVVRCGDVWLVVGARECAAVADRAAGRRYVAAVASDAEDPASAAARACLAARLDGDRASVERAAALVRDAGGTRGGDLLADPLRRAVLAARAAGRAEDLVALARAAEALAPDERGEVALEVAGSLRALGEYGALRGLLQGWVESGDATPVRPDVGADVRTRLDLHAAAWLRAHDPDDSPITETHVRPRAGAVAAREAHAAAQVVEAAKRGTAALAATARRHADTDAAWAGRVLLLGRHVDEGSSSLAAAASDARVAVSPRAAPSLAAAAALRSLEAHALRTAEEPEAARKALHEATAVAPALCRSPEGACGAALAADLVRRLAFVPSTSAPERRIEPWPGGPPSEAVRHATRLLVPTGPGAGPDLDTALALRGGDAIAFDLRTGEAVACPADDAGFLGVTVLDREACVPGPGVLVGAVTSQGGADAAGLHAGDWILAVDDVPAADREAVTRRWATGRAGERMVLDVRRNGAPLRLEAILGRRSTRDRWRLEAQEAFVATDGSWTVPGWLGLRRVDPRTGRSTEIWRWDGSGRVGGAAPFAGTAYVWTTSGPLEDGWIVAVDVRDGRERWRTAIPGSVAAPPRVVGSALVVDTRDEDRTWLLDAATGAPRAAWRRADARLAGTSVPLGSSSTAPVALTADAGGCVHLLREDATDRTLWWTAVDPATGGRAWARPASDAGGNLLLPPLLAGGSVAVLAASSDSVRIAIPDLRGGLAPGAPIDVDGSRFEEVKWGGLDADARVAAWGDLVHVVRVSRDRRASVGTIEVDRRAAADRLPGDPADWHPAHSVLGSAPPESGGDGRAAAWPLVTSVRATAEGVWVSASYQDTGSGRSEARVLWFEPTAAHTVGWSVVASATLAQPPVRVGRRALLPTDDGWLVIPLEPVSR
ncbi:MAG TPA: PQQ-binding-like beta-propeller repeat protein [Planctomycetota bacterium]|nr:PQQ-binding-like beta-propeller repeat protein [Planctomycetota bacterium]